MSFVDAIIDRCQREPDRVALQVLASDTQPAVSYRAGDILHAASVLVERLKKEGRAPRVGIVMANTPEWVAADLALLVLGCTEVPVPLAFSAEQARSLLAEAEVCLTDAAGARRLEEWGERARPTSQEVVRVDMEELLAAPAPAGVLSPRPGEWIAKIIHTSGTTGAPKGVRIRLGGLDLLLGSLRRRLVGGNHARYLSLVPLSLLIEQVSAVYMTLLEGGTAVFLPRGVPVLGEAGGSPRGLMPFLRAARPTAMMLPPSMVEAIHTICQRSEGFSREELCDRLFGTAASPFLTCGGAPTSPELLRSLASRGLDIYEGYGLSENGSVVACNAPGRWKIGTVGTPLEHVEVKLAADGELLIRSGSLFAGYTTTDPSSCLVDAEGWLKTGDLADIDEDGFIRIRGRKKNLMITSNGRNISPEWVESQYQRLPGVEKAVVFGEGLESLQGFFVIEPGLPAEVATRRIQAFGREHLSEVERVELVVTRTATPELYREFFTITGRPRRSEIHTFMQQTPS